jgi:hypothetical protein
MASACVDRITGEDGMKSKRVKLGASASKAVQYDSCSYLDSMETTDTTVNGEWALHSTSSYLGLSTLCFSAATPAMAATMCSGQCLVKSGEDWALKTYLFPACRQLKTTCSWSQASTR